MRKIFRSRNIRESINQSINQSDGRKVPIVSPKSWSWNWPTLRRGDRQQNTINRIHCRRRNRQRARLNHHIRRQRTTRSTGVDIRRLYPWRRHRGRRSTRSRQSIHPIPPALPIGDVVKVKTNKPTPHVRNLIAQLDHLELGSRSGCFGRLRNGHADGLAMVGELRSAGRIRWGERGGRRRGGELQQPRSGTGSWCCSTPWTPRSSRSPARVADYFPRLLGFFPPCWCHRLGSSARRGRVRVAGTPACPAVVEEFSRETESSFCSHRWVDGWSWVKKQTNIDGKNEEERKQ